ncbi:MAG: hypothetical protein CVU39_27335 [Chloroflexi bacterium HGW-Chloroflexi-10]|nr:MAG: hypothetical protein CVU39_27335 [Chloroflexi bacterium HGW-Chloroflexi-10]
MVKTHEALCAQVVSSRCVFVFRFYTYYARNALRIRKKIPIGTNAFLQNGRMGGGVCDGSARFAAFLAGIRFGTNGGRMGQEEGIGEELS